MQTEKEKEEAKCSHYEKNSNKKQGRSQGVPSGGLGFSFEQKPVSGLHTIFKSKSYILKHD